MRPASFAYSLGLAVLAAGALSGCGLFDKKTAVACPQYVLASDAATVTRFREGPGRDLTDVISQAEIGGVLLNCKPQKEAVDIDLQIAVNAIRGPADRSRVAEFSYFVALVGPDQNILVQEPFTVRFDFRDNRTQLVTREEIAPHLPLSDPRQASSYRIWIGFQMTPEELAWNRSQRGGQ